MITENRAIINVMKRVVKAHKPQRVVVDSIQRFDSNVVYVRYHYDYRVQTDNGEVRREYWFASYSYTNNTITSLQCHKIDRQNEIVGEITRDLM